MGFNLNLNDINEKDVDFKILPKGKYEAVVQDAEFTTSKKGSPMVKWTFATEGNGDEFDNKKLFNFTVLDQTFGLANFKKHLVCMGIESNQDNFDVEDFCASGEAIGLPIKLVVGIDTYEGTQRNKVSGVEPSDKEGSFF
ncbi:MAG: DUF669 domain-containing protein [Paraclostridium sp.]